MILSQKFNLNIEMNSSTHNLFRKEVVNAHENKWMGSVILTRPFSFTILTFITLCIGLIIIIFLTWGTYTKHSTVQGQLIPQSGLVQVYPTLPGTIIKKYIYEGKNVKKGDILYVISTTSYNENGDINGALIEQIYNKEQSIRNEILRLRLIHQTEKQINLSQKNQNRYYQALKNNAASYEEFELKRSIYLDQLTQYKSLEREKIMKEREIQEQKITLTGLNSKQKNEIELLERSLSNNTQELIQIKSKQSITIIANMTGAVSNVNAEIGQYVDLSKPLLSILPENTQLVVQLYVPSRSIGFIKASDQVLIRYQAYPYQKFGHAKAQVISVSKTALAGKDLTTIGIISPIEQLNNEPLYLVRARLNKQSIQAYGKEMPLQVGMICEGDIMNEKRKLYEWALEPLLSVTGKL
ncbi:Colicin V secretion protein CvaA [compost metagenome]